MSGKLEINVHTAALIRHRIMAKTPTKIFAMDKVPSGFDAFGALKGGQMFDLIGRNLPGPARRIMNQNASRGQVGRGSLD
jgi:hypothetical protein